MPEHRERARGEASPIDLGPLFGDVRGSRPTRQFKPTRGKVTALVAITLGSWIAVWVFSAHPYSFGSGEWVRLAVGVWLLLLLAKGFRIAWWLYALGQGLTAVAYCVLMGATTANALGVVELVLSLAALGVLVSMWAVVEGGKASS